MTKLTIYIFGILIVLTSFSVAEARHNDGLEGLIIGGVGGAAIGHVVTGTPEGVIAGSFLGGTIGMLIDADNHRNRVVVAKGRHRYHRDRSGYYDRGHRSDRGDRYYYDRGHRSDRGDRHYYDRGHRSDRGDRYYYGRHGYKQRWDRHRGRHLR